MLGSLKKPFSVIGISETWLTDCTAELVNITGYNFVSNYRKSKTGGGVGIYLQNDLQYKLLKGRTIRKVMGGRGIFELQEFYFVIKFFA